MARKSRRREPAGPLSGFNLDPLNRATPRRSCHRCRHCLHKICQRFERRFGGILPYSLGVSHDLFMPFRQFFEPSMMEFVHFGELVRWAEASICSCE
jgi:hypothetical protein